MKKSIISLILFVYVLFNSGGFVTDVQFTNPADSRYQAFEIAAEDVPEDVLKGCYRVEDNQFVVDQQRENDILAGQETYYP